MRRNGRKKAIAGLMALTLLLSTVFFALFKYDVFGAVNNSSAVSPNPYVKDGASESTTVGLRGSSTQGTITLTDEGSNVQGKNPAGKYEPWKPYDVLVTYKDGIISALKDEIISALIAEGNNGQDEDEVEAKAEAEYDKLLNISENSLGKDFVVPGTYDTAKAAELTTEINEYNLKVQNESDKKNLADELSKETKKGGAFNPFTLLEIVPDKAMQELTYFTGSEESGLPFNEGYLSATMMNTLREKSGTNYRFVSKSALERGSFIKGQGLMTIFGKWTVDDEYNVFKIGVEEDAENNKEKKHLFDYEAGSGKQYGEFNYNEVYNFDITTDDLLKVDAVNRVETRDPAGNLVVEYREGDYSKYLIAAASNQEGADDNARVRNLINNKIKTLHMENRKLKANNKTGRTTHITSINKYNLTQPYLQANGISASDLFNNGDVSPSGGDGSYDVTWSRLGRSNTTNSDNYWRVLFKKYYVDHFEDLYDKITEADMKWKFKAICNGNYGDLTVAANAPDTAENRMKKQLKEEIDAYIEDDIQVMLKNATWDMPYDHARNEVLNNFKNGINESTELANRDKYLKQILQEYAPLLKDKGIDSEAIEDYMDWDTSATDMLSKVRTYQAEPQGGYVLAVKPGMGDMYLVTDVNKIKAMGGKGDEIVFARDKKAPEFNADGTLKEKGDDAMRWIHVPSTYALNGAHHTPGEGTVVDQSTYQAGYLDDDDYTYGFASKSVRNLNDMWLAIYDRANRKFHAGTPVTNSNSEDKTNKFDNFSKKMLIDTQAEGVWNVPNDAQLSGDEEKVYRTYANDGTSSLDKYHLYVLKQLFGTTPHSSRIVSTLKIKDNNPDDDVDEDNNRREKWISNDVFGSNLGGLLQGEEDPGRKVDNILYQNNNLIDKRGYSWFNFDGATPKKLGKDATGNQDALPWLFDSYNGKKLASSKYITGLCLNFYDLSYKATNEVSSYPDIYNKDVINGSASTGKTYTAYDYFLNSPYIDSFRYIGYDNPRNEKYWIVKEWLTKNNDIIQLSFPGHGSKAKELENARYNTNDDTEEAVLVDRTQVVTEKVKKYHFTYYGFGANDILKQSLFNFTGDQGSAKYKDFHYKVLCVTPAEMNTISYLAKFMNSSHVVSGVKLDLAERGDMFYFHTLKTKSIIGQDDMEKAFTFYSKVVTRDNQIPDVSQMKSFYQNDLEWDQVLKIIKRSSNARYGGNLPIMYNGLVAAMSEEAADPGETNTMSSKQGKPVDTTMYMFNSSEKNMNGLDWSGNMSNIMKMYLITIQFDLRAVKGAEIDEDDSSNASQTNSGTTQKRKIERTFMKDIFPYLKQAPYSDSYTDNKSVPFTANYTGFVNATAESKEIVGERNVAAAGTWGRKFATSSPSGAKSPQFFGNTMYLWNQFTFYPADKKLNNATDFIAQGYLKSYYSADIFAGTAGAYRYLNGSNGVDDQNVYVLHVPGNEAGLHADSIISSMGDGGGLTNKFLDVAYKIMHNTGDSNNIQIEARPRNKVYTLLGKDGGTTDEEGNVVGQNSNILMDYYRNPSLYKNKIDELFSIEKNVKIRALNANNEIAVITDIELQNSGDSTKKRVYEGDGGDDKHPLTDILDSSNAPGNMTVRECSVEGHSSVKYGLRIEDQDEIVFHVPYTIGDFFDGESFGGHEFNGYDRIVIHGYYWTRNRVTQAVTQYQFTHTVKIHEREMALLE